MLLSLFSNTDIINKVEAMIYFIISVIYYFIPCFLGSFINVVIANRGKTVKRYKYITKAAFIAIAPSVIMLIIIEYFGKDFSGKENLFLGGAFVLGLCGDQITAYSVKLKGLAKLIVAFQRFKENTEVFNDSDLNDIENGSNTDIVNIEESEKKPKDEDKKPDDPDEPDNGNEPPPGPLKPSNTEDNSEKDESEHDVNDGPTD